MTDYRYRATDTKRVVLLLDEGTRTGREIAQFKTKAEAAFWANQLQGAYELGKAAAQEEIAARMMREFDKLRERG